MLVMVFLALIGMAATTTTTIEIGVAGNERAYKENLYRAEAATMVCAQQLENEMDDSTLEHMKYAWLDTQLPNGDPLDTSNWEDTDETEGAKTSEETVCSGTRFFAVYEGVAHGAHIGMSEPTLRAFSLFGRSQQKRGVVVLQVGYKKRF
jgi:hypothetical protein